MSSWNFVLINELSVGDASETVVVSRIVSVEDSSDADVVDNFNSRNGFDVVTCKNMTIHICLKWNLQYNLIATFVGGASKNDPQNFCETRPLKLLLSTSRSKEER